MSITPEWPDVFKNSTSPDLDPVAALEEGFKAELKAARLIALGQEREIEALNAVIQQHEEQGAFAVEAVFIAEERDAAKAEIEILKGQLAEQEKELQQLREVEQRAIAVDDERARGRLRGLTSSAREHLVSLSETLDPPEEEPPTRVPRADRKGIER